MGLISIILQNQSSFLAGLVVKALIIPVLISLALVNLSPLKNRLQKLMVAGLFFSWAGDVFMELSNTNGNMFIPGLLCFLLAHIMYLTVFFFTPGKNCILFNRFYLVIPVLIYGIALVTCLYTDLKEMRLPVILYAFVILAMLTGSINRMEKVNKKSYYLVLAGAILFVISDSVIAINKFGHRFEASGIIIMSTYVVAQYFIIAGYIYQFSREEAGQHISPTPTIIT